MLGIISHSILVGDDDDDEGVVWRAGISIALRPPVAG